MKKTKKCREKYPFQKGEEILSSEVWGICEERIREECVIRVEAKKALLDAMKDNAPPKIVWQPMREAGFGASPFNPNCWRTIEGAPIISPEAKRSLDQKLKEIRAVHYPRTK